MLHTLHSSSPILISIDIFTTLSLIVHIPGSITTHKSYFCGRLKSFSRAIVCSFGFEFEKCIWSGVVLCEMNVKWTITYQLKCSKLLHSILNCFAMSNNVINFGIVKIGWCYRSEHCSNVWTIL